MQSDARRAVLVGAGHAHLYTLRHAREFAQRGFELVLVAPGPFWYSGLATGMVGGTYPSELDQVNVAALVARGGGRFLQDEMVGLDLPGRTVRLKRGDAVPFDALSLNIGSVCPSIPGAADHAYAVKPIQQLWDLRRELERRFVEAPGRVVHVAIGGGGATGVELAANIANLARIRDGRVEITVYVRGDTPLRSLSAGARVSLMRYLTDRGVKFRLNAAIEHVRDGHLSLRDGAEAPFDLLLNATGLLPPAVLKATALPIANDGALIVDRFLRSPAAPEIFGGGDCVAFDGRPLPRIGVFAVRQAPVLFWNLLATLEGTELKAYEPQRKFLSIMALGEGQGLAVRGGLWWQGRLAFLLKDWIDRRFLREYQQAAGQTNV